MPDDLENRGSISELSVDQLQDLARDYEIAGRSNMKKKDLVAAIEKIRASDNRLVAPQADPEYEALMAENRVLRARLGQLLHGAVGASQPGAPNPGEGGIR